MKWFKNILLVIFTFLIIIPSIEAKGENTVNIYLFYSSACPHCKAEKSFLEEIEDDYDYVDIHRYEVDNNESNSRLMDKMKRKLEVDEPYVPFTIIGEETFVGFDSYMEGSFKDAIEYYSKVAYTDPVTDKVYDDIDEDIEKDNEISLPFFGEVDAKDISLPIVAVVMGAIDGFNPCAMWILLFLIGMLFHMKDKKKMWALGLTFLVTSALVYMLIMLAWIKVASLVTAVDWFRLTVGIVAIIGAGFNLYSYYKTKDDGCTVVDDKKRKKTFDFIKKITSQKKFILALLGVIALAISVNIIELACSAGLPLTFTQLLAINNLTSIQYFLYILLYIIFFLIDDIIVFVIAMKTLELTGISTKYGRWSHLIGGIIMLLIGLLLIFKPEILMFNF